MFAGVINTTALNGCDVIKVAQLFANKVNFNDEFVVVNGCVFETEQAFFKHLFCSFFYLIDNSSEQKDFKQTRNVFCDKIVANSNIFKKEKQMQVKIQFPWTFLAKSLKECLLKTIASHTVCFKREDDCFVSLDSKNIAPIEYKLLHRFENPSSDASASLLIANFYGNCIVFKNGQRYSFFDFYFQNHIQ